MNGNQFVQSYAPTFYKQQGLGGNSFLYNLLGQVVGFVGCFVGLVLLDITGRRACFIFGGAVVTILLYVASGLGLDASYNANKNNAIVACFILQKPFSRISATNCAFLTGAEIGGVKMRKKILAVGTSCDVLGAFLVTFVTPYLLPSMGVGIGELFRQADPPPPPFSAAYADVPVRVDLWLSRRFRSHLGYLVLPRTEGPFT